MSYRYIAYTAEGERFEGFLDVETEEAAERILWDRDLTIAEIKLVRKRIDLASIFPTFFGPKTREVILFSRQLATLLDSGVALISALQLLGEHITNKYLGDSIRQIEDDIRMGLSLPEAMEKHPVAFTPIYCRMIEVGQRTGNFGGILRQLATYLEKAHATAGKIRGAMAYPIFVLLLAVVVVIIIVNVTLPPLTGLFEEFGGELPLITRILLALTKFFSDYSFHLFIGMAMIAIFLTWYVSRPAGRRHRDQLLLKLPVLGKIIIQGAVSRISRTMTTLLQAGLALPEVMELTKQTIENVIIFEALDVVRNETLQGHGISEPMARVDLFPTMVSFMLRIGEETGTLDSHLETLANFYEEEVDRSIKTMTAMLEPAMTIFVGFIVGLVAVSVIMPMYNLLGAIK